MSERKLTLRTPESEEIYRQKKVTNVNLWERPAIYETENYRIINNDFPYDLVYEKSLILLTKDPVEKAFEYAKQYTELNYGEFDQVIWNTPHAQSQGHINHVHILRFKRI